MTQTARINCGLVPLAGRDPSLIAADIRAQLAARTTLFSGAEYDAKENTIDVDAAFSLASERDTMVEFVRAIQGLLVTGTVSQHDCPHATGEQVGIYGCRSHSSYQEFVL